MKQKINNISWNGIHDIVERLSESIKKFHNIDYIVGISRGGLVPARYFAKILGVRRVYSLGIEFYNAKTTNKIPFIYQELSNTFKKNDEILIVDDIVDSGESMNVAIGEVSKRGSNNIITCSLHYKPKSIYIPNYYGEIISNDLWIEYDWE